MKRNRSLFVTAIATLTLLGVVILSQKQSVAAQDDSAAINHAIDGFTAGFNQHDSHGVAIWFTEDADFTNVTQSITHGRKDIEQHFVPLFAGRLKNTHRTYKIRSIRLIRPDVATVNMDYVLTGAIDPNGKVTPVRKGLYDWIVTKQDGKWLINVFHESEFDTPPPPVPAR